ncbi:MAG: putative septum site-determining protein MinC [Candidatus Sericytochromatia bacterium]|nr:MAG: putative septum site-determining protein MinC [Candidatus Sericytochromatia bacterium]
MNEDILINEKKNSEIVIKGVNNDLLIIFPEDISWNDIVSQLTNKLEENKNFWIGASVSIDLGKRKLDETQINRLHDMLIKRHHLILNTIYTQDDETKNFAKKINIKVGKFNPLVKNINTNPKVNEILENNILGNALYIKQTVRSGQIIRFDGNIIIYGDTNPGSEIIATGDIVVIGSLKGLAHAGAKGDDKAQIIAINLKPTQLRISSYIGRPPDDVRNSNTPEYAWVSNGEIHISSLKLKNK